MSVPIIADPVYRGESICALLFELYKTAYKENKHRLAFQPDGDNDYMIFAGLKAPSMTPEQFERTMAMIGAAKLTISVE